MSSFKWFYCTIITGFNLFFQDKKEGGLHVEVCYELMKQMLAESHSATELQFAWDFQVQTCLVWWLQINFLQYHHHIIVL